MTISGWIQIALFSVIVILIARPFGLHDARLRWRADISQPGPAANRTRGLLVLRRRREGGAALAHLCRGDAVLQRRRLPDTVRATAAPMVSAVQPAGPVRRGA